MSHPFAAGQNGVAAGLYDQGVLLAFADESYSDAWFFMAAAVADAHAVSLLEWQLPSLVAEHADRLGIDRPQELHGYDLLSGLKEWKGVPVPERMAVGIACLKLFVDCGLRFVIAGLDREAQHRKYKDPYPPYPLVLNRTFRALDELAERESTTVKVWCDEIGQHDRHRAALEKCKTTGSPGYRLKTLRHIAGDLEHVASWESAMIQAADLVAYIRHRTQLNPAPPRLEARVRRQMINIISPAVVSNYLWIP